jgi:hypothetical protein
MRSDPRGHVRHLLGAFALGHASESEDAAVKAHLEGCEECRREAAELAGVSRLLPFADPERLDALPGPPPDLLERVFAQIRVERGLDRRRSRRRTASRLGLGIAAAIVALVLVAWPFGPDGEVVALASDRADVTGEVTLYDRDTSQRIELQAEGLPLGETFGLWIQDRRTGERIPCGTFIATPGSLRISLYSSVPRERAQSVGVSTLDGEDLLQAPLPAAHD